MCLQLQQLESAPGDDFPARLMVRVEHDAGHRAPMATKGARTLFETGHQLTCGNCIKLLILILGNKSSFFTFHYHWKERKKINFVT